MVIHDGAGTIVKVHADCRDLFARVIAQADLLGDPAVGLLVGLGHVEVDHRIGVILEDHAHFHLGGVVRGGLVKGNGYLGIFIHGQVRLV